jgi:hypothetical protein
VVGDGHSRHFLAGSFIEQLAGFARAVKQAEVSVYVKVDELWLPHEP